MNKPLAALLFSLHVHDHLSPEVNSFFSTSQERIDGHVVIPGEEGPLVENHQGARWAGKQAEHHRGLLI